MEPETDDLYDRLASFEHLLLAYRKAARGKRSREDVASFDYHLEGQLLWLRNELRAETYRPGPYRRYQIRDPKPRVISAASFRDRVVHHALCACIEPLFERRFIRDSYANRRFKGIHAALDRCQQFARHYRYVLRCDIVQFFPSIDLDILRFQLERVIQDARVLRLCRLILAGGSHELTDQYDLALFPGDDPAVAAARPRGLPIGNQTSQFWANCYLNPLDHFIKSELRCPAYLRYVDDFALFSDEKAMLWQWKAAIVAFLGHQLRLTLHDRESTVSPVMAGIPFLGFTLFPSYRRLRRRNMLAFAGRLRGMYAAWRAGNLPIATMRERVRSWVAHAAHADSWHLRASLFDAAASLAHDQEAAT